MIWIVIFRNITIKDTIKKLIPKRLKTIIKNHIPQRYYVEKFYTEKTGRRINLRSPQRFSEKLGWYKLYYRDEKMKECTDKAAAREYVESVGLGYLLNECYGVYESIDDIPWETLPHQFAIKNTLGGANW